MIKRPTKLSFSPHAVTLSLVVFPLIGFFVYALYNASFFPILVWALFAVLLNFTYFHLHLVRKRSEAELEKQDFAERINVLTDEIERESRLIDALSPRILRYSYLKEFTEEFTACLTLNDAVQALSSQVTQLFGQNEETLILYLFHSKTGELGLLTSQKGQLKINLRAKKGDVFDHWVVKNMQPLLIEDAHSDFRFDMDKIAREDRTIGSLMSVPLLAGPKAVGILRVDSAKEKHFNTDDLRLLRAVSDLGAVAIDNTQLYEKLEDLAARDGLTGLFLRRQLLEYLGQEMSRVLRRKEDLSFLMIDIDDFKKYNDTFGHAAGDIVLRSVAQILGGIFIEPGQMVCRYGGEEFAVALPGCPKKEALNLAEEVRKKIAGNTITLRREKTRVAVSIGVASFPADAQIKEELIQQADSALYRAKEKGKNRVEKV